jgi:rRNA-processing protein FCF1
MVLKNVIFDTNFLIHCIKNKVDFILFSLVKCFVFSYSLEEVKKKYAHLILQLIRNWDISILPNSKTPDKEILEDKYQDYIFFTYDKEILQNLKNKGRQRRFINTKKEIIYL